VSEPIEPQPDEPQFPFDRGTAGASARREHERRKTNREQRTRAKHPHIGRLLLALKDEPHDERVWAQGAGGEEYVGQRLAKLLNDGILLLHDRRIPGSRANIDHIAVASSGVWVIDTKRYRGKVEIRKPLLQPPRLMIAGRDKSKLTDGLGRQVELVRTALGEDGAAFPVYGAMCFVDADLPMPGTLTFDGYPLLYVKPLAKRINQPGPISPDRIRHTVAELARRFPSA
jgi:hypothetical protein